MTTFARGQSLWSLYFVPLEIPKLDNERKLFFSLYLKTFARKNITIHFYVFRI